MDGRSSQNCNPAKKEQSHKEKDALWRALHKSEIIPGKHVKGKGSAKGQSLVQFSSEFSHNVQLKISLTANSYSRMFPMVNKPR